MKTLILLSALTLSGCANADYDKYIATHRDIHTARASADVERYKAMAAIAQSGSEAAKVAALITINNDRAASQAVAIAPPKSTADAIREWAGLLIPAAVQGYSIRQNTQLGIAQSNNSARVAESTNAAFVGMAGQIQAPGAVTNLSGTGSIGGDYAQPPAVITPTVVPSTVITPVVVTNPTTTP
jgi:hypothetical protein